MPTDLVRQSANCPAENLVSLKLYQTRLALIANIHEMQRKCQ